MSSLVLISTATSCDHLKIDAHLRCLKLERESVVHKSFELLVILVAVLSTSFTLDLFELVFVGQIAFDSNVTRIKDKRLTVLYRDAICCQPDIPDTNCGRKATHSIGMMMMGAFMSTLISTVL